MASMLAIGRMAGRTTSARQLVLVVATSVAAFFWVAPARGQDPELGDVTQTPATPAAPAPGGPQPPAPAAPVLEQDPELGDVADVPPPPAGPTQGGDQPAAEPPAVNAADDAMQQEMFEAAMAAATVEQGQGKSESAESAKKKEELDSQGCPKHWGCWDLIYATKGAILGVQWTLNDALTRSKHDPSTGFMVLYALEHFAIRDGLSVHVNSLASIGGGSAGTERNAIGELDLGFRGRHTDRAGPFVRAGPSAHTWGNDKMSLWRVEPLTLRAGYQLIDGDFVVEGGVTQGYVPAGRFRSNRGESRDLSRGNSTGLYGVVRFEPFRVRVSALRIDPPAGTPIHEFRAAYCDYRLTATICGELSYYTTDVQLPTRWARTHVPALSVTFGFSP